MANIATKSLDDLPLRERKKAQTREALFHAALELVSEHGFESTTVDQIADRAGVSRRTFFRYFPSKEAVLFALHGPRLKRFQKQIKESRETSALERVKDAFLTLAEDFIAEKEALLLQQQIILSSTSLLAYEFQLDWEWEEAIVSGLVKEGTVPTLREKATAAALIGVIRAALREWFASEGTLDLVELGTSVFALLEEGVSTSTSDNKKEK